MTTSRKILIGVLLSVALSAAATSSRRFLSSPADRLVSGRHDVRNEALNNLERLPAARREAVKAELIVHSDSEDPRVRRFALYALRRLRTRDAATAAAAADRLTDRNDAVRTEAAIALIESGKAGVTEAVRRLSVPSQQAAAVSVLVRMGPSAIPDLSEAARSREVPVRRAAVIALGLLEGGRDAVIPLLTSHLKDEEESIRAQAALGLHRRSAHPPAALPVLTAMVSRTTWGPVEEDAVKALSRYGLRANRAAGALHRPIRASEDGYGEEPSPAALAASALAAIAPRPTGLADLVRDLRHNDSAIRFRAAYHIGQMAKPPMELLEPLVGALADPHFGTAGRALFALRRIGFEKVERMSKVAYPRVLLLLGRKEAARVPGFFAAVMPGVAVLGVPLLDEGVLLLRRGSIKAAPLMRLSGRSKPDWEPALRLLLTDENAAVRLIAVNGLARLKTPSADVRKVAEQLTTSSEPWIVRQAGDLLAKFFSGKEGAGEQGARSGPARD